MLSYPKKKVAGYPKFLNHPEVTSDARPADDLHFLVLSRVLTPENLIRELSEFEDYFFFMLCLKGLKRRETERRGRFGDSPDRAIDLV